MDGAWLFAAAGGLAVFAAVLTFLGGSTERRVPAWTLAVGALLFAAGAMRAPAWGLLLAPLPAGAVIAWRAAAGAARRRKLEDQLAPFLDRLAASLRAGAGLEGALRQTADDTPEPLRTELRRALQDVQVGRTLPDALQGLAERVRLSDAALAAAAIQVSHETGGSLGPILEQVARLVRDRRRLAGRLQALTAQGRMQAVVVGSLPALLGLFLWTWDPETVTGFAASTAGQWTLVGAVLLEAAGLFWIWRIVRVAG